MVTFSTLSSSPLFVSLIELGYVKLQKPGLSSGLLLLGCVILSEYCCGEHREQSLRGQLVELLGDEVHVVMVCVGLSSLYNLTPCCPPLEWSELGKENILIGGVRRDMKSHRPVCSPARPGY